MIPLIALAMLVCYWILADQEVRPKLIVTGIYLLTWPLILLDGWWMAGAQAIFALVVGAFTFAGRR